MKLSRKEMAREMGLRNRKYDEVCSYCGKPEHYAKGYCRLCYARYRRNGFVEPLYNGRSKRPPKLTEKQIKKFLKDVKKYKNNLREMRNYFRWQSGNNYPTFNSAKKVYEELGMDIYKRLKIKVKK